MGLGIALGGLNALDNGNDRPDETLAAVPVKGRAMHLAADEVNVDGIADRLRLAATGKISDTVANLCEDAEHTLIARSLKAEVVGKAVPEGLSK